MSTQAMVPVFDPQGNLGDIPHDNLVHAVKAGATIGVHINDPDGNPGVVPANRLQEAIKAGAKMVPLEDQPANVEGFGKSYLGDLWSGLKGAVETGTSVGLHAIGVHGTGQRALGITPVEDQIKQTVKNAPAEYQQRKKAGYSLPYRLAAPPLEALGTNVPGMEQSAREGDVRGVLGHAAAGMTQAAAPLAAEGALRLAHKVLPSTTRAGAGLNMLTDSPDAAFAQHPVEPTRAITEARKIRNELEVTGEKPPVQIQALLDQAEVIPKGPIMNMFEARTMLKRVNDVIDASKGFTNDTTAKASIRNLKRFAGELDKDISEHANNAGFGQDYANLRNEYRHGSQIKRVANEIGPFVGGAAGAAIGSKAGGLATAEGAGLGALAGKALGKPTIGAVTKAVINRGGTPKLRSLPPTPEAYTRTLLEAKEGNISPGEADRRITRMGGRVKIKPLPQVPAD